MNCTSCSSVIEEALSETDGVTKARVSFQNKEAIIWYDSSKIQGKQLQEVIIKAKQGNVIAKIIECTDIDDNADDVILPVVPSPSHEEKSRFNK